MKRHPALILPIAATNRFLSLPDDHPLYPWLDRLERHAQGVYLGVAVVVLLLLALGIRQAWRSQELHSQEKIARRSELLRILRRERTGCSAEGLSREIGLPSLTLVRLLEELEDDGLVVSHTNTQRLTTWSIKASNEPA